MFDVTVYPLSMSHQLEFTNLLSDGLKELVESKADDSAFFNFLMTFFRDNIHKVFGYLIEEDPEKVVNVITNEQFVEIAEIVYEVNFASVSKNVKSLLEKTGIGFPSRRQSPPSAKSTVTGLNISTKKASKKEA